LNRIFQDLSHTSIHNPHKTFRQYKGITIGIRASMIHGRRQ
jgi:hypothetical protein